MLNRFIDPLVQYFFSPNENEAQDYNTKTYLIAFGTLIFLGGMIYGFRQAESKDGETKKKLDKAFFQVRQKTIKYFENHLHNVISKQVKPDYLGATEFNEFRKKYEEKYWENLKERVADCLGKKEFKLPNIAKIVKKKVDNIASYGDDIEKLLQELLEEMPELAIKDVSAHLKELVNENNIKRDFRTKLDAVFQNRKISPQEKEAELKKREQERKAELNKRNQEVETRLNEIFTEYQEKYAELKKLADRLTKKDPTARLLKSINYILDTTRKDHFLKLQNNISKLTLATEDNIKEKNECLELMKSKLKNLTEKLFALKKTYGEEEENTTSEEEEQQETDVVDEDKPLYPMDEVKSLSGEQEEKLRRSEAFFERNIARLMKSEQEESSDEAQDKTQEEAAENDAPVQVEEKKNNSVAHHSNRRKFNPQKIFALFDEIKNILPQDLNELTDEESRVVMISLKVLLLELALKRQLGSPSQRKYFRNNADNNLDFIIAESKNPISDLVMALDEYSELIYHPSQEPKSPLLQRLLNDNSEMIRHPALESVDKDDQLSRRGKLSIQVKLISSSNVLNQLGVRTKEFIKYCLEREVRVRGKKSGAYGPSKGGVFHMSRKVIEQDNKERHFTRT